MARPNYPPTTRQLHGLTLATPQWRRERASEARQLRNERLDRSEGRIPPTLNVAHHIVLGTPRVVSETSLIIPAAQHPLVDGERPGPEFEHRLKAGLEQYRKIVDEGGKAEFFLTGNRHHDAASGQTDKVALYDAGALWLLENEVPATDLNGKNWIDESAELIYSGADEIRVAYGGFRNHARFLDATYICSPGQRSRASIYALAHGFPLTVSVPETLRGSDERQFHSPNPMTLALDGLTQTIDPYGDLLARKVVDRIPTDGVVGTLPELLPQYSELPWYAAGTP